MVAMNNPEDLLGYIKATVSVLSRRLIEENPQNSKKILEAGFEICLLCETLKMLWQGKIE
jgi:hypothetical protein